MSYESERMKVIENIFAEMKKHTNDNGEVECYPSYDQEALKLVDDGHVDWLYERVQEMEDENDILRQSINDVSGAAGFMLKKSEQQNKRYREAIENIKRRIHLKHETALELSVGIADEIENLYKDLEESE